jgi:ADP-heptose:LPS heptosyltransferase
MSGRKILIVNLTRFGDLLQTGPTIAGLRAQEPDCHITVVVEKNFAEVCEGLPGIDRIWPIDLDALGRLLLQPAMNDLRAAYGTVEGWVKALRAERFDLALNYSSSRMSAVLLQLIGVSDTRGWTATADGFRVIAHQWARLFSAACLNRQQAPFNLVDYYKRVAGVSDGPRALRFEVPPSAHSRAAATLRAGGWDGQRPLIGFQLGASRVVRRWPSKHFIAVGRALEAQLGATLVLCGGKGERGIAEELAAGLGSQVVDLCGRTSIAELGGVLAHCDVLLTSDTGPMHMAVAVGTPVVALFFGPALPVDTGPYAPDHVCLHAPVACAPCDHNITCLDSFCRDVLEPAAVVEAICARRAEDWAGLERAAARWAGIAWYRTAVDREGLADLVRLGDRPPTRRDGLRRAYRALWKHVLDGTAMPPAGIPLAEDAAAARELVAVATAAATIAAQVQALVGTDDIAQLEDVAGRLELTDRRLFQLGQVHEALAILVQTFRFEKESLEGADLAALAAATRGFHEDLAARARCFVALLDPVPRHRELTREEKVHASCS